MKKFLGTLFTYISRTKLWHWFANKYVAHLNFRAFDYTKFPIDDYLELEDIVAGLLKEDNAIAFVLCDTKSLAAKIIRMIGSDWTHAGLFWDSEEIVHMKAKGITKQSLLSVLKTCDNFAIVKFDLKDGKSAEHFGRMNDAIDAKYQYDFTQ